MGTIADRINGGTVVKKMGPSVTPSTDWSDPNAGHNEVHARPQPNTLANVPKVKRPGKSRLIVTGNAADTVAAKLAKSGLLPDATVQVQLNKSLQGGVFVKDNPGPGAVHVDGPPRRGRRLKNLKLSRVDVVHSPANQPAKMRLFKETRSYLVKD